MDDRVWLEWAGKGRRAALDRGTGRWLIEDRSPLSPLEMTEVEAFGDERSRPFAPLQSNLLIRGENLQVLNTLLDDFRGRVRLIYLDPPYNTGQEFEHYSDRHRRALWLTMMHERLELLRELLTDDGSIYVQLDWNAVHYCKTLMDEVFGEDCFQREIIWRIGWVSGFKTRTANYVRNHDTLLFYSRRPTGFLFNKIYVPHAPGYRRRDGSEPKAAGMPLEDTWNCSDGDRLDSIQIMSFSGEKTGFATQKNESLLERVITVSSNPGDLVLDCFAGSGTTGAVAHKTGRRWIMIELGGQAEEFCLRRMRQVVNGTDQSGISRKTAWKGGGGFRYWIS